MVVGDASVVGGVISGVVVAEVFVVVLEELDASMLGQRKLSFSSRRISLELKYKLVSYKMNKEISNEMEIIEIKDELKEKKKKC